MDRVAKVFNGIFTLQNRSTGEHRTFRIRTQKSDAKFAPGKRIAGVLTGTDNNSNYTGFGFVTDEGINVWRKKRDHNGRSVYEWYAIMLWAVATGSAEWEVKYEMLLEARCIRCNRRLTHPDSIKQGIGPECAGRI